MKRRDFLALAGAAAAVPRIAFAQQVKLPHVAFLSIPVGEAVWDGFVGALADAGYVDGKTMALARFTAPTYDDLPTFGTRVLATNPDVLVTNGSTTTLAAKSLTATTPIVFISNAPIENGLVASLAHPGANLTGVSNTSPDLVGNQLGILKEALPSMRRVAVLNVPRSAQLVTDAVRAAAAVLGIETPVIDFIEGRDFVEQLQGVLRSGGEAVYVPQLAYFSANRNLLFDFELKSKLPLFWGEFIQPFLGVLAYAVSNAAQYHRMVAMVDAILKGAKPANIPVEQPTVYDLAVNLKTAQAIGITIPPSILLRATELIE